MSATAHGLPGRPVKILHVGASMALLNAQGRPNPSWACVYDRPIAFLPRFGVINTASVFATPFTVRVKYDVVPDNPPQLAG